MATLHGPGSLGIRWAIGGVTSTAFGSSQLDSLSVESEGETYIVKNAAGSSIIRYDYDPQFKIAATYTVTGASANTSASITRPVKGDLITLADTLNQITGSGIVDTSKIITTNSTAVKVEVNATIYELITS
jgi:hypothetical protein